MSTLQLDATGLIMTCPNCGQRNIVKEGWFVCGVCGADLPATWNFDGGGETDVPAR